MFMKLLCVINITHICGPMCDVVVISRWTSILGQIELIKVPKQVGREVNLRKVDWNDE